MVKAMAEPLIDEQALDEIAKQISPELQQEMQCLLSKLKKQPPGVTYDNQYRHLGPIQSIPSSLGLCQSKLHLVLRRYSWQGQICSLQEILKRSADHKIKRHEQEKEKFIGQINELNKDKLRLLNQIRTLLGIKDEPSEQEDETAENPETSDDKPEEKDENSDKLDKEEKKKRKPRGAPKGHRGNNRVRPDKVDKTNHIAPPSCCPHCNHDEISQLESYISKYIEDIPPIIKMVTENRYLQGCCDQCGKTVVDPRAQHGPLVSVGPNLIAALTIMRQQMGVSYRKLARFSTETCQVPLSPSGAMGIIDRVCKSFEPFYKAIEATLPSQSVLYADETYWKMDGDRWYIWAFCNQNISFFHADKSRAGSVPKGILGADFEGLLHSDFYGVYNQFRYTQKCLVHYLRDIKNELKVNPNDPELKTIKQHIQAIIKEGKLLQNIAKKKLREEGKQKLEEKLDDITKMTSDEHRAQVLINRIINYRDNLLNFIDHQDAESHNNLAERRIRPLVIFRKISFGNRSEEGARRLAILMTVMETCKLRGQNLTELIQKVLATPPDEMLPLIKLILNPPPDPPAETVVETETLAEAA